MSYILPNIQKINPSEPYLDAFEGLVRNNNLIKDLNFFFENPYTVVLSGPGGGKSRLLKEIVLHSTKQNHKALYIDLKKMGSVQFKTRIFELLKKEPIATNSDADINNLKDYFLIEKITEEDFSGKFVLCLDALDEVKNEAVGEILEHLKTFSTENTNVKIVVSCRNYIYGKYSFQFSELNPAIVEIKPFGGPEVWKFLTERGFNEDEINKVSRRFSNGFNYNIINSPRILEIFAAIKDQEGLAKALKKTKAELLEAFIYGKLEVEDKKSNNNNSAIIKRVLEKIALCMEIYQSKEISKDELLTFFDDIKSNLGTSFLSQVKLEDFYDRFLLIPSTTSDNIQFENAEFQEYLAAKEITRLGKIEQVAFDLVVDTSINEIKAIWVNTLRYLLELEPKLQVVLMDFLCRKEDKRNYEVFEKILIDDPTLIETLSPAEKSNVFNKIFQTYQLKTWNLSRTAIDKLPLYYTPANEVVLLNGLNPNDNGKVAITNSIVLFRSIKNGHFNHETWKTTLVGLLKNKTLEPIVRDLTISALVRYRELALLRDNIDLSEEKDKGLIDTFVRSCVKIEPNSEYTIDAICYVIKNGRTDVVPRPSFDKVTTSNCIKYILKKLGSDPDLLYTYKYRHFDKFESSIFLNKIEEFYDPEIFELLNSILFLSGSYIDHDSFLLHVFELIKKKESNYLSAVMERWKTTGGVDWYKYSQIITRLLNDDNVDDFILQMQSIPDSANMVARILIHFKWVEGGTELFEKGRAHFPDQYKEAETHWTQHSEADTQKAQQAYQKFKHELEPSKGMFSPDVFEDYIRTRELIKPLLQTEDIERLLYLLKEVVLKYDFSEANMTITGGSRKEGSREFSLSQIIAIFGKAIPVLIEYKTQVGPYRDKVLEFLPFGMIDMKTDEVFELIGPLREEDVKKLTKFYSEPRKDDTFLLNFGRFIEICRHYRLISLVPVLQNIVLDKNFDNYQRVTALKTVSEFNPDTTFYYDVFKKTSNVNDMEVCLAANELLLKGRNQHKLEALKWRIAYLLENPIKQKKSAHDHYDDFWRNEKANSLKELDELEFQDEMGTLLTEGVDLYERNEELFSYSKSLWFTVFTYFENLRIHKSYDPLTKLEELIGSQKNKKAYQTLLDHFGGVKNAYLVELGKPRSFMETVQIYNDLKQKIYAQISSPKDFYFLVRDIIEIDIRKWVEKEGAYKNIIDVDEDFIQKTLKSQIHLALLQKGIRDSDIRIKREEQLLNDFRADITLSHGFCGQIVLELKLAKNPETKQETYKKKLLQYIEGTYSDYGMFIIFQTTVRPTWVKLEPEVRKIYEDCSDKVHVLGLNCNVIVPSKRKKTPTKKKATGAKKK